MSDVQTISSNLLWHCQGSSIYHTSDATSKLLETVKTNLPRIDFKIRIDGTGYIVPLEKMDRNGWAIDDVGRVVFVFGEEIYFQRYMMGTRIMRSQLNRHCLSWYQLYDDEAISITEQLEK